MGKRKEGYVEMSFATVLDLHPKNESEVENEIAELLWIERPISYSDSLILNAYNSILLGQYNDAIVTSNVALEIFILETLKEILQLTFATDSELEKALNSILENKLHATFRKNFLFDKKHSELMVTSDTYRKFDAVRDFRKDVIHRGKRMSKYNAEININYVHDINVYLIEKSGIHGQIVLQRALQRTKG